MAVILLQLIPPSYLPSLIISFPKHTSNLPLTIGLSTKEHQVKNLNICSGTLHVVTCNTNNFASYRRGSRKLRIVRALLQIFISVFGHLLSSCLLSSQESQKKKRSILRTHQHSSALPSDSLYIGCVKYVKE